MAGPDEQPAAAALPAAEQAQCAAEVAAFKAGSLPDACDFVAGLRARGVGGASYAVPGWPADKWGTLCEAAEVYANLRGWVDTLLQWRVDAQVRVGQAGGRAGGVKERLLCQGRSLSPELAGGGGL